jgi:predicted nucleic acid-binding Zn ribbon protein
MNIFNSFNSMSKTTSRGNGKSNLSTVGESLNELLKAYRIKGKFDATRLTSSWERLMGRPIARRTKRVFVKDRKLFVELSSAPLKHELVLSKSIILDIFDKEFDQKMIDDIIFI